MVSKGLFITFEGIEGSGKSTQIKKAAQYLKQRGVSCLCTQEPGGTILGRRIREILLNEDPYEKNYKMYPEAEVLLFSAARAQHVREVILPNLKEGKIVLCDRFSDATCAYQGFGRGIDMAFIQELNFFTSSGLKPHLTLLFDLPVEDGLKRARERISTRKNSTMKADAAQLELDLIIAEDVFEKEALDFHRKVKEGYLWLAGQEPERFKIIDASKDIFAVHREVCIHLDDALEKYIRM